MGFMQWFLNNNAAKSSPDKIISSLKINKNMKIADLGSGGGYFTFAFSKKAEKVFAVDVDLNLLKSVREKAKKNRLDNVLTVRAAHDGFKLPEKVDLIFTRNAYHHFENRVDYFKKIKQNLKAGGRIAIIDYRKGSKFSFLTIFKHYSNLSIITKEMKEAGYKEDERFDFLKNQSFTIFK